MQRVNLPAAILIIVGLMLLAPGLAKAQWPSQSGPGLHLSRNEESGMTFPRKYVVDDVVKEEDREALTSSAGRPGYWFEDFPWLGLVSKSTMLKTFAESEESLKSSIDADTGFDPLSSLVLFRYRNWQLEPFVGIRPTFIFSEPGSEKQDSLNHMFLGILYTF